MGVGGTGRVLSGLVLPDWGRVVGVEGPVAYGVVGADGTRVEPIDRFLREFAARGNSASSVRSYAGSLLRWWRFLQLVEVAWDRASPAEGRDFVLWMRQATKPVAATRTATADTSGQTNPITGKPYPGDGYAVHTVRHSNAVVRSFYEFFGEIGEGPLRNPMPRDRAGGRRAHAHHNPMEAFAPEGRLRYNPKAPHRQRRSLSDQHWAQLFAVLRSDRDRAVLALAVSTAARAGELLGLRAADVDWGQQTVQVQRKGSGALQRLPGSPEAFVWLRLWVNELGELGPGDPLWQTLRRRGPGQSPGAPRRCALTYDALRAVLRRANESLGTNWSMHDLRHTCALRMLRSASVSVRDVQVILGHAHLSTTQVYLDEDDHEVLERVHRHLAEHKRPTPPPVPGPGYDPEDLAVLLGAETTA
jgi:integrase/recombinase XerD